MEVLVKHDVISDAPFKGEGKEIFAFDNKELIYQLKQEILYGNPTSFLVSGYRGVGKTSFISKVEQDIKKDIGNNTGIRPLFIKINSPKYQEHSLLLRKIIREVYLSIQKSYNIEELRNQNKEIVTSLELLFERTFKDVEGAEKNTLKYEDTNLLSARVNLKRLTLLLVTLIISGINIEYNLIDWLLSLKNNNHLDLALFIIPAIWTTLELFSFKKTKNRNKTDLMEINRKTLYDDEIAEYQLNRTLSDLKELKIRPVFVLDELDKIDDIEQLESLIGDLKSLMLSGLASFILVSGQDLYYKFNTSHVLDDALISSIFSNTIHVPLLSTQGFIDLFSNILEDTSLLNKKSVVNYIKSQILNSNRLPRRFIHLIKKDLIWRDDKAYLRIDDKYSDAYSTDAKLLGIIDSLKKSELLVEGYGEGIIDFFTNQLHIWIQKIKLKGNTFFSKDEVYNLESDYKSSHPNWYFTRLNALILSLLEELSELELLEKRIDKSDEDEEFTYYRWTKQVTIKTELDINQDSEFQSKFLSTFIEFENYLRRIYQDIFKDNNTKRKHSVAKMLRDLENTEADFLKRIYENKDNLKSIIDFRNRIVHGEILKLSDLDLSHQYNMRLKTIKPRLAEDYTYFVIKKYLSPFNYSVNKKISADLRDKYVFDFEAVHQTDDKAANIFFSVKYYSIDRRRLREFVSESIQALSYYNSQSDKNANFLLVFYENTENIKTSNMYSERKIIDDLIQDAPHYLRDCITSLYISENQDISIEQTLLTCLNDLLKKGI
ncbi:hypothetical protein PMEGAS67_50400 [Priestia megaterium]